MKKISRDDRGQSIIEFVATFPIMLIVLLIIFEVYITITTVERIDNAARTCARQASQDGPDRFGRFPSGYDAGREAMPDWVNASSIDVKSPRAGGVACTVAAKVPVLWKSISWDFTVIRRVDLPIG